jgi:hypothetical protein
VVAWRDNSEVVWMAIEFFGRKVCVTAEWKVFGKVNVKAHSMD